MTLEAPEKSGAKKSQRVSCNSTIGEIWLAYLHLVNAKHSVKSPDLFRALDAASSAALKAQQNHTTLSRTGTKSELRKP
jgi:hypothetical protein